MSDRNDRQVDWVLRRLRTNPAPLTPAEALREAGIMRLAARVQDLRDQGHEIVSELVTVQGRTGPARVAAYQMVKTNG